MLVLKKIAQRGQVLLTACSLSYFGSELYRCVQCAIYTKQDNSRALSQSMKKRLSRKVIFRKVLLVKSKIEKESVISRHNKKICCCCCCCCCSSSLGMEAQLFVAVKWMPSCPVPFLLWAVSVNNKSQTEVSKYQL